MRFGNKGIVNYNFKDVVLGESDHVLNVLRLLVLKQIVILSIVKCYNTEELRIKN